jgi:hypothetical protein
MGGYRTTEEVEESFKLAFQEYKKKKKEAEKSRPNWLVMGLTQANEEKGEGEAATTYKQLVERERSQE